MPDGSQQWQRDYQSAIVPILNQFCAECHRGEDAHGFDLDRFQDTDSLHRESAVWDEVGKRIRLNEMPPEGSPGLSDPQKAAFHRWLDSRPGRDLCATLATDETKSWYRGYVMSRRLTRTEYLNCVSDLVAVRIDPSLEIPSDGAGGEGFDTSGDSLFTSAVHVEQYLAVADSVIGQSIAQAKRTSSIDFDSTSSEPHSDQGLATQLLHNAIAKSKTTENEPEHRGIAADVVKTFARRAWRRPVSDDEVDRLMTLFDLARKEQASFGEAVGNAMMALLVSPHFLFVVETETPDGGVQRLTPHQLATRMALFIWSSLPDEELLRAADENRLDSKEQVIAQAQRMVSDPKARALGENFGLQWLGLTHFLHATSPDNDLYPHYSERLAEDLREEAVRSVWSVFRDGRSLLELIDSDHVQINGTLASHYGIELAADADWQEVPVPNRRRGGVITLGAVLSAASYPRRTSPVLRGRWVLEEILGGRVPPPPPNVPPLDESEADHASTLRERLELHRKNPDCAACHNRMDPLGFGLENFDAIGRWRDQDGETPIDSTGKLPSGETFNGPEELKRVLLNRSGEFKRHFVKKMLGFALGRELNEFDDCVINDALKALDANDQRASVLIETIVTSYPFQHRYFKAATKTN
ncbi:DUF1588 domain-containing protein [Neorhodopirellula pilleata]|uniref:DUF1588 domain-containing protein n=1 Tax=Neorhodopirellula pilleata TaxID=2714738 RepID=UPI001E382B6D|nr:DUF1588 domain-containing protein [Neorhodopirellula pilleata]